MRKFHILGPMAGWLFMGALWTGASFADGAIDDLAIPSADQPAPEPPYDLGELVILAIAREAGYRAAVAEREAVLGGVDEAAADAWPQVDLISTWGRSRNPSLLTTSDFEDILEQFPSFEPGEQEVWNLRFELEQALYSGGKVRAAIDLAELAVDIHEARLGSHRLELALTVADGFFELLGARAAVRTLESQAEARRGVLEVVEARYEIGEATELERLRARASVAELGPTVATAEGRVMIAESRLQSLLGLDSVELEDPGKKVPAPAPGEQALFRLATERRPELADLKMQSEALLRQKTVIEAEGRPQLELRGAYGRQAGLPDDLADQLFDDWRIGLSMTWNLFDGGRRRGEVRQVESEREQVSWRLIELERAVRDELRRGVADYRSACARFEAARESAAAAQEAARVAAESYGLGVALQTDLLDANDQATRQSLVLDQAFYECLNAWIRLKGRAGLMPAEEFAGENP